MIATVFLAAAICNAEVCPERQNDFCWENDKFGMRAYGPGDPHVWSGFDLFNKATNAEATCAYVLHNARKCGNWHGLAGRVYGTVSNVFTITNYDGLDPEINNGYDNQMYPRPINFIFGVNFNL